MPLRDHFRSPLTDTATWEELHGQWLAEALVLPLDLEQSYERTCRDLWIE